MAFSFYDILNEAEDDNAGAAQDAAPAQDNNSSESEAPKDDDFSIDTDPEAGEDEPDGVDSATTDGDDVGGDETGGDMGGDGSEDEENENDHDIFLSLPKEEQQMKMRELKKQYGNLYSSLVDLCNRIDDIEVSDDNKKNLSRIYMATSDIKTYIADYIIYILPSKSYIENDIALNNYLYIINSISTILDKIIDKENKIREEGQK
jgi:hypothetical protein